LRARTHRCVLPRPSCIMEIQVDAAPAATQPAATANDVYAGSAAGRDVVMATAAPTPAPAPATADSLQIEMPWPGRATPFRARPRQSAALSGNALIAAQAAWDALDKTPERQAIRQLVRLRQHDMRRRPVDDSARRVRQRQHDPVQVESDRGASAFSSYHITYQLRCLLLFESTDRTAPPRTEIEFYISVAFHLHYYVDSLVFASVDAVRHLSKHATRSQLRSRMAMRTRDSTRHPWLATGKSKPTKTFSCSSTRGVAMFRRQLPTFAQHKRLPRRIACR